MRVAVGIPSLFSYRVDQVDGEVFEMALLDFGYREMGCMSPFLAAWSANWFPIWP